MTTEHSHTIHITNTHARIAVCSCGWSGGVHPGQAPSKRKRTPSHAPALDAAEHAAVEEWRAHAAAGADQRTA